MPNADSNPLLLVPVHLDAYLAPGPEEFTAGPTVDFSRLPYSSANGDVNMGRPYLAEEITAAPFQNVNTLLPAGMHLHWTLPRALVRGRHDPQTGITVFPCVPDRWLVTRYASEGTWKVAAQWVVESNYLYAPGAQAPPLTSSIPLPAPEGGGIPYRYIGRALTLSEWQAAVSGENQTNYLKGLSATVHGEPAFAAYYPDCSSLFGFYDAGVDHATDLSQVRYEIAGWYSDAGDDPVTRAAGDKRGFVAALESEYDWTVPVLESESSTCSASVYCARLDFAADARPAPAAPDGLRIAVGDSGMEAVAALLGSRIAPAGESDSAPGLLSPDALWQDQIVFSGLFAQIGDAKVDLAREFQDAWHRNGFRAYAGGVRWKVRPPAAAELAGETSYALALEKLNTAQQAYDAAVERILALQRQTFCDWSKFMIAQYPPEGATTDFPDADRVQFFVRERDLDPLQKLMLAAGQLTIADDQPNAGSSPADSLAAGVVNAYADLIAALPETDSSHGSFYQVSAGPAAPFYRPADPVVLLSVPPETPGNPLTPRTAPRLDEQGYLSCYSIETTRTGAMPFAADASLLAASMDDGSGYAFATVSTFPFIPLALEWEADIWPVKQGSNLSSAAYAPGMIQENYVWNENGDDLVLNSRDVGLAFSVFTGSTLLTAGPVRNLGDSLDRRWVARAVDWLIDASDLKQEFLAAQSIASVDSIREDRSGTLPAALFDFFLEHNAGLIAFFKTQRSPKPTYTFFVEQGLLQTGNLIAFLDWCQTNSATDGVSDCLQIVPLRVAADTLDASDCLLQTLGGFHEALLMRHESMQLSPSDPFAFQVQSGFTERVATLIQGQSRSAPLSMNDFHPIRNGAFRITRLRLIDAFGRYRDLPITDANLALSRGYATVENPPSVSGTLIAGGPRLAQPARLELEWVAAAPGRIVSGYLLPNAFNDSIDAYSAGGAALGSLANVTDGPAAWSPAPGESPYYDLEDAGAAGPGMAVALTNLRNAGGDAIKRFVASTLRLFETKVGADPGQESEMALLVGRPLAVAQARVALRLRGGPAVDESWLALALDMNRTTRETNGFENVRFPLIVGRPERATDGLLGYWIQDAAMVARESFANLGSFTPAGEPDACLLTATGAEFTLTLVFDPRSPVHFQTGLLPVRSLAVAPAEYAGTLRNLELNLFVAPVLGTPAAPAQSGFAWRWTTLENRTWNSVTPGRGTPKGVPYGRQTIAEGWLQRTPGGKPEND